RPPAGGWPRGVDPNGNLTFDLRDLLISGAVVGVVTFRPSTYQAVLVVAATDIDAAEAVLRPQLSDRLCIVPSRWTRTRLDDVRAHLYAHWDDWNLQVVGEATDEHAQLSVYVQLRRVSAAIADWADTLPEGLLRLEPSLTRSPTK